MVGFVPLAIVFQRELFEVWDVTCFAGQTTAHAHHPSADLGTLEGVDAHAECCSNSIAGPKRIKQ